MNTLLTVEQLSVCLHKSVASIRSDATRNPRSLPPLCRLPGTKRLLWRAEDVERWLATFVTTSCSNPPPIPLEAITPLRRGRPTKAMQVASARQKTNLHTQAQVAAEADR